MISRMPRITVKLFFKLIQFGFIPYIILALYIYYSLQPTSELKEESSYIRDVVLEKSKYDVRFILFDSYSSSNPSVNGRKLFEHYQCPEFSCYMTSNKKLLKNFDAVVINVIDLANFKLSVPRPKDQRYVLYAMEPSDHTPIRRSDVDHFFDYTWSYKISSDILSPFFTVQDLKGVTVAPSLEPRWSMGITKSSLKEELAATFKSKSKAVAMVAKSCWDYDGKIFANKLRGALSHYSQTLDVLGCWRDIFATSDELIARKYFFVLVTFESESQDYITDKVLKAYNNNAVPIIKANANLTQFLPPGSYIDARLHTPQQIATIVNLCMSNMNTYRSFFKWTNFYTFHKRREFEGICRLCSLLFSEKRQSTPNLREWWGSK